MENDENSEPLPELLFFDTFSHESCEKANLDLVQFPKPVVIYKITIIPLGTKINAEFPGGVRLGATNPSAFSLKYYVNDLTKPNVSTFSDFGSIDYKDTVNKEFVPYVKKPTDGLLIRGCYRTLTLAIFGEITDLNSISTQCETPSTTPVPEPCSAHVSTTGVKPHFSEDLIDATSVSIRNLETFELTVAQAERNTEPIPSLSLDIEEQKESNCDVSTKENFRKTDRSLEKEKTFIDEKVKEYRLPSPPSRSGHRSKSPARHASTSLKRRRSRSKSPFQRRQSRQRSRSPYAKRRSPSPYSKRQSPHSTRSSRSPKSVRSRSPRSVRSRSPRSIQSLSPSPRYRMASPSSRSVKSSKSLKSTSSTSHSPLRSVDNSKRKEKLYDLSQKSSEKAEEKKEETPSTNPLPLDIDLLEPVSSEHSVSAENVSDDGDLGDLDAEFTNENNEAMRECDDFEAISSDEEYIDDSPPDESDVLVDYSDYQMSDYSYIWTFDPFQCEFSPLTYFDDPTKSSFQRTRNLADPKKSLELMSLINSFKSEISKNEKWIEAVETTASEIHSLPLCDDEVVQCLIDWVIEGLDYDLAIKQPLTGYKVRHIKAGIKLLIALFDTNENVVNTLLSTDSLRMLMDLYFKPYMSLPVKLLITRGFDAVCNTAIGIHYMITRKYLLNNTNNGAEETCYQMLLNFMITKPPTRLSTALIALLRKIHFFESLGLLRQLIRDYESTQEVDILKLRSLLCEITNIFKTAKQCLSQRLRYLPATSQFQVSDVSSDVYLAIYRWFKFHDIVDSLTRIYHHSDLEILTEYCDDLLGEILNEENGTLFLLGKDTITKTNYLQRILMQSCDDNENHSIGFRFSYTLQAYYLIDSLFALQNQENFDITRAFDDPEIASMFHRLYALVFSTSGRRAVVESLTNFENLKILFPFLTPTGNKKVDSKAFKSVCTGYAVELCLLAVQSCEDKMIQLIENHGENLLIISSNEYLPKLSVIASWLWPLKNEVNIAYNEHTFKALVGVIKKHSEAIAEIGENGVFVISYELITVVRILKQLCVNPSRKENTAYGASFELKYKYGITQIYMLDSLSLLVTIVNKLLDTYLKPSHQSPALVGNQGSLVIFFMLPTLKIIKEILYQLTSSQGKDFKDVTPVPVFLRIYSLMSMFPSSSVYYSFSQEICSLVVDTLMIYTQICLSASETEEAFTKSVWTKMLHEVFIHTFSTPLSFIHGLTLLSELLPLPFPLQVAEALNDQEITKLINFRKLWSAHLHVLSSEIDALIESFVFSSSQYIQQLLRRVCIQISDLSASSALTVVKSVMELLLDHIPSPEGQITQNFYSILNLLTSLINHPPFKITFIQMIYGNKCEEKYGQILNKLLHLLKFNSDKLANIAAVELLTSFIQSLCDPQVSLNSIDTSPTNLQNLSNTVPPKDVFTLIANSLISQLSCPLNLQNMPLMSMCFRVISQMCEHDFGFWCVKQALMEKYPQMLYSFLSNICNSLQNDKYDYCKQLLQPCLDFLKLLLNEDEQNESLCHRQYKFCFSDMRKVLKWDDEDVALETHPLLSVQKYLYNMETRDDKMISSIEWFTLVLKKSDENTSHTSMPQEPVLPSAESLNTQFSERQTFYVRSHFVVDRQQCFPLSAEFFDCETSVFSETKKIDLLAISEKYCGSEFDLKSTLEELCKCQEPGELPGEATNAKKQYEPLITQKDSTPFTTAKTPFVAPMRGRGFSRPGMMMMHSTRVNDPFRSRPPNTSRPPSMHVDDFVALEQGRGDNFGSSMKRPPKDYRGCSPNSRPFNPNVMSRSYYPDIYPNRRPHLSPPPLPMHQPMRPGRYARDYSPQGSRSRSGSTGPSSGQHWKPAVGGNRRDSREIRDIRRLFPR